MALTPFSLSNFQNGSATPDYRLSDAVSVFSLEYAGVVLQINEPVGWDSAEWVIRRDPTWHGQNFEFTGDEATLKFRQQLAIDFLEQAYRTDGPNANVLFRWVVTYEAETLPLQLILLNFMKRSFQGRELTLAGERLSLHPDIKSKWDTICTMTQKESFAVDADRVPLPIVPPAPAQIILHSQSISGELSTKPNTDTETTDWQSFANSGGSLAQSGQIGSGIGTGTKVYRTFFITFLMESQQSTVQGYNPQSLSVTTDDPILTINPVFVAEADGRYDFEFIADFQVEARLQRAAVSISPPKIKTYNLDCWCFVDGVRYNVATPQVGDVNDRFLTPRRITGTFKVSVDLAKKSVVHFYGVLQINPNRSNWRGTDVNVKQFNARFSVKSNTTAPASTTGAYPIIDVLRHYLSCATGRSNAVQSSFYSLANSQQPVDGGGSRRVILNGYGLRGFLSKPPQGTMKSLLSSLQAIDAIGIAYRPTPDGEVMVVEPIANFYRDQTVIEFSSYTLIQEEVRADLVHTNVVVGYDKYPDEGAELLDEFNTRQEYVLPNRKGGTYNQTSSLISSGYAIETTRRAQFADKPQDSTTYDDDLFIICVNQTGALVVGDTSVSFVGTFTAVSGKSALLVPLPSLPAWLTKGVTFQVVGGVNNGTYRVVESALTSLTKIPAAGILFPQLSRAVMVLTLDRTVTPFNGPITVRISTTGILKAERDENFQQVIGINDPATVYNLRLAPRYNFLRHSRYIAGGLFYANGSEVIRCTFSEKNSLLKTRLRNNAPGDLNIDIRRLIQHTDKLYIADIMTFIPPIWTPETVKVSTKATLDQMLYMRACFTGYHPDLSKHYGKIILRGAVPEQDIEGFPMEIMYKPKTGELVLTLLKKFIPLHSTGQRGCSFYGAYTFAQFEALASGDLDNWIYNCRFSNFQ